MILRNKEIYPGDEEEQEREEEEEEEEEDKKRKDEDGGKKKKGQKMGENATPGQLALLHTTHI